MDPNRLTLKTQEALHDAQTKISGEIGEGAAITVEAEDGELVVRSGDVEGERADGQDHAARTTVPA